MSRIGLAVLALASALAAQTKFEVASIRPVPANAPTILRPFDFSPVLPGGQYVDAQAALWSLIVFAYDVKNPEIQLTGLPNWAATELFSVAAKASTGLPTLSATENREYVREMMRALLAERFHLRLHRGTRHQTVFRLELQNGPRFKEVPSPEPPQKSMPVAARMNNTGGRMVAKRSTMSGLAEALAALLKHPVADETALNGYYDFDLTWRAPDEFDPDSEEFGASGVMLLIANLKERLGLRLAKTTGAVEYWLVDHVERPTEN